MSASSVPGAAPASDPTTTSCAEDPIPAEVQAVIALFANQLTNVSFPDVDAAVLRRQADELRSEAEVAARARESLDAALAAYVTRLALLTETARRAVAYAKIYSEAHPDQRALATAIAALSASAPGMTACPTAPTRRRSRPVRRGAERHDPVRSAPPEDDLE